MLKEHKENSKENIQTIKEFYEERGCVFHLCDCCKLISCIEWPKVGLEGPSFSSSMFCQKSSSTSESA